MEGRIHELKEKKKTQSELERENRLKTNQQSNRTLGICGTIRKDLIFMSLESWKKKRKKESSAEKILTEIMTLKSPLLDKRHKPKESRRQVNIKQDKFLKVHGKVA